MWAEAWALIIPVVTRAEAENRARALNHEHPDRARYRWMARASDGSWDVVRLGIPGGPRLDPLKATVESRPQPEPREDPRPLYDKNVGGPWTGAF
jgi:hypothetical protein